MGLLDQQIVLSLQSAAHHLLSWWVAVLYLYGHIQVRRLEVVSLSVAVQAVT